MKAIKSILCVVMAFSMIGVCALGAVRADYTSHVPIRIDGNGDFSGIASSGNGTMGNPWIIENHDINGTNYGYCIYIGNTTDYFVVRDCYLHDAYINSSDEFFYPNAGIILYLVEHGTIEDNNITSNTCLGIYLYRSEKSTIDMNSVSYNECGICLVESSEKNIIDTNIVSSNECGICLLESSDKNIITNNTVDSNTEAGIFIDCSDNNVLNNNTALYNGIGFYINDAEGNVAENEIANYNDYGFYIENSTNNIIKNSTICLSNVYGIKLDDDSSNNAIYHNNLANNSGQAYDAGSNNQWDDGYPSGGNYWGDYNGTDNYSGPGQNISGSDGIGDTPYTSIDGGSSEDGYPLMEPADTFGLGKRDDPIGLGKRDDPI